MKTVRRHSAGSPAPGNTREGVDRGRAFTSRMTSAEMVSWMDEWKEDTMWCVNCDRDVEADHRCDEVSRPDGPKKPTAAIGCSIESPGGAPRGGYRVVPVRDLHQDR